MRASELLQDVRVRVSALVCVCFLLGSAGWLAWLYRITDLATPTMVDFYTMVLGYLAQIVGIGAYMLVRRSAGNRPAVISTMVSLGLYVVFLEPATMSADLAPTLAFGYTMNVMCGYFQGHYLTCLASLVAPEGRGTVFGGGYAVSTLITWLLSSIQGGALATGTANILICLLLALLGIFLVHLSNKAPSSVFPQVKSGTSALAMADPTRTILVLAGVAVVLVSLVKNAGFSFPAEDLSGAVNLELSRLFYGMGS